MQLLCWERALPDIVATEKQIISSREVNGICAGLIPSGSKSGGGGYRGRLGARTYGRGGKLLSETENEVLYLDMGKAQRK